MFDIRVFNALAAQTSMKIGQLSFNVTTPASIWFERVKRNEGEQFGLQITNLGGKYLVQTSLWVSVN